jgi:hypothetical protein
LKIKAFVISVILPLVFLLAGCAAGAAAETKAFVYRGLKFEVSGVLSDRTEVYKDDGGADVELLVITCGPEAKLMITDPDMHSGEYTESGKPYPRWGLDYKSKQATGEKVRIDDKTGAMEITEDLIAIYDLESSLYVVKFEITE